MIDLNVGAASKAVMRAGQHYALFTVHGRRILFGVIRPGWDVEGFESADYVDGHVFYDTASGRCWPAGIGDWEGIDNAGKEGDQIGLLLDLDKGSLTVYKNGGRLGVMVPSGLTGEYCWAVSLYDWGSSARIESAPVPAVPVHPTTDSAAIGAVEVGRWVGDEESEPAFVRPGRPSA